VDYHALEINANWLGVSNEELMENAGKAISEECMDFKHIAVFCGPGNNGGDGLVAARYLAEKGHIVNVFLLMGKFTDLNKLNQVRLPDNIGVHNIESNEDIGELKDYDLIVDALMGMGFKGKLRGPMKGIVDQINGSDAHKLSVDTPSGGRVEADSVISLHDSKVPGAIVVPIGIPPEAEVFCGPGDVYQAIPERASESHKGDYGRLLVVGGCKEYIGTPTLVAQSALKTGLDLVTVCVPQYVADKMPFDPNLIVKPLDSKEYLTKKDVNKILKIKHDAIVIGNGMGRHVKTVDALETLLSHEDGPIILDADALSIMDRRWIRKDMVLTPHHVEFERLFEKVGKDLEIESVRKWAKKTGAIIALKGAVDIISNGIEHRLNMTGNPRMTVGGTGDVLAGIIAGLTAQNKDMMVSTCAGAFLTGLAGDLAHDKLGVSMVATDVIDRIHLALEYSMEYK